MAFQTRFAIASPQRTVAEGGAAMAVAAYPRGAGVVACGMATETQRSAPGKLGCDESQGATQWHTVPRGSVIALMV